MEESFVGHRQVAATARGHGVSQATQPKHLKSRLGPSFIQRQARSSVKVLIKGF
ncbi:hypothetical protein R1T40_22165 (plasmid) [Tritonibacter scottomollicae]|uniref:Uncharacterized protein n=1 Tax=Tritonibacter scottomollicae TaxID=483013 RepID=A0ABZ0HQ28_TRISK|nr:hypothetical protein [Tritonibacter scottomollicae]WOI35567.1 hypothetical protein R1T40_22165 [Tritonibacter scottomollicae]